MGNIRGDVEVCQRIFDSLLVVGDDRESSDLGSGTRSGWDCTEFCFGAQFREVKGDAQLLEGGVRIFIECPHCLCSIDWRTAADRNDPVRLEFAHFFSASHNGFDRWVCLDSFKQANLHAGLLEVVANLVKESKTFHAAAANNDDGTFAVQCFECFQSIFAMIKISW